MAALGLNLGAGVISGLLQGILGGKAANEIAAGKLNATNNANQTAWIQNLMNRSDLAPYVNTGQDAISTLGYLLGLPGATGGAASSSAWTPENEQKLNEAKGALSWFENVLAGRGGENWTGGAPKNAATVAKFKGEMQQRQREIDSLMAMKANADRQAAVTAQLQANGGTEGSPLGEAGSLMKDFTAADFDIYNDPGAAYRMQEAQKALERSAAARGGVQSGGTLKALTGLSQDMASQEFQNAYNRFQTNRGTKANLLLGAAGMGQNALGQQVSAGQNTASQIGQNTMEGQGAAAEAQGAGTINTANTINSTLAGLMDLYNLNNKGTQSKSIYGATTNQFPSIAKAYPFTW